MARNKKVVEWRLEPHDGYDIIDPLFFKSEEEARRNIVPTLGHYVDAKWVDVCRVERTGNVDDGIVDEVYDYRTRHYRGMFRTVRLTTVGGAEPVEVAST